jgi:signal transduction histidine kinase/ligand-binding sensor domain-containing protein
MMAAIALGVVLGASQSILPLDPSLYISQYAHTAWRVRDGFSQGNIYAIAQTPDGYLWLASELGLVRFDGVRFTRWHPPAGRQLPTPYINSLLVSRDGTLWIGTMAGLASWDGTELTSYPGLGSSFIASLFEDHEGTLWVGTFGTLDQEPGSLLCAIRVGKERCDRHNGVFGRAIWGFYEDSAGNLWGAAESGLWRLRPGSPKRYPTSTELIGLSRADDGHLLIAVHEGGLMQLSGDKLESFPVRGGNHSARLLRNRDVDSNRILRDRDGGLWIGTVERGLIHIHNGQTDVFTKADGLSGNVILAMFEDREGDIWVASTGGLDRFRELPVSTVSERQGLSSDASYSVLSGTDGSIWVGAHEGLTRLVNGKATVFGKAEGLPNDMPESLFEDGRGRIWVATRSGLAYFQNGRFVAVLGVPGEEIHFLTGDKDGSLWLAGHQNFLHVLNGRIVERIAWSRFGHPPSASGVLYDPEGGGFWLGFWRGGGLVYFKDGRVQSSYGTGDGLGKGETAHLRFDRDGAVWVATQQGGLSRFKDGHFITLTTRNGLPCDVIHWSIEDNEHSLWLYTSCGLVRIARTELDAWIADPRHKVETTVWDAADGVRLRSVAASPYSPRIARASDGKLWYVTGEGVQVIDPHHLAFNKLRPSVQIEKVVADDKSYWENLPGAAVPNVILPARTHDLQIFYTALSLVAPEKVHFKYRLEGQDEFWREVVNDRDVQYSNLGPGTYRFRVIASNNSGVWNEVGDSLQFSVAPAYYQTNWFRALCAIVVLALAWLIYQMRLRQLRREFALTLEARVAERTSIARELHDTLLQSFHGLMLRFQIVSELLPNCPVEAKEQLGKAMDRAAQAITEGRDAVQGLRTSTVQTNDLAQSINTLGEELAGGPGNHGVPAFRVTIEGESRDLHPILRDEVYRIAAEALRNAFRHAAATHIEVEIRYDHQQFRLRVRDDGKGMDPSVLSRQSPEGHYGLPGMRERASLIGGTLEVWSEIGAGTEVELSVPAARAYGTVQKGSRPTQNLAGKA